MSSGKPKDARKRQRINMALSAAEYAEICRKVPPGERSEWCRERIFLSANFRDPMFDVGARLMSMVVPFKRFKKLLQVAQDTIIVAEDVPVIRVRDGDSRLPSASQSEMLALIKAGIAIAEELLREAGEVRRLIAAKEESARRIVPVERRDR